MAQGFRKMSSSSKESPTLGGPSASADSHERDQIIDAMMSQGLPSHEEDYYEENEEDDEEEDMATAMANRRNRKILQVRPRYQPSPPLDGDENNPLTRRRFSKALDELEFEPIEKQMINDIFNNEEDLNLELAQACLLRVAQLQKHRAPLWSDATESEHKDFNTAMAAVSSMLSIVVHGLDALLVAAALGHRGATINMFHRHEKKEQLRNGCELKAEEVIALIKTASQKILCELGHDTCERKHVDLPVDELDKMSIEDEEMN